jgi:hypothetical protein
MSQSIVQHSLLGGDPSPDVARHTLVEFDEARGLTFASRIKREVPMPATLRPRPLWSESGQGQVYILPGRNLRP